MSRHMQNHIKPVALWEVRKATGWLGFFWLAWDAGGFLLPLKSMPKDI